MDGFYMFENSIKFSIVLPNMTHFRQYKIPPLIKGLFLQILHHKTQKRKMAQNKIKRFL